MAECGYEHRFTVRFDHVFHVPFKLSRMSTPFKFSQASTSSSMLTALIFVRSILCYQGGWNKGLETWSHIDAQGHLCPYARASLSQSWRALLGQTPWAYITLPTELQKRPALSGCQISSVSFFLSFFLSFSLCLLFSFSLFSLSFVFSVFLSFSPSLLFLSMLTETENWGGGQKRPELNSYKRMCGCNPYVSTHTKKVLLYLYKKKGARPVDWIHDSKHTLPQPWLCRPITRPAWFVCVWYMWMSHVTHSYVRHDSFIYATWLIHMWDW